MTVPAQAVAQNAAVSIRILEKGEISAVAPIWKDLERRVGCAGFACSWTWTETWLRHYGDTVDYRFAIGEHDGEPCGVVLLTKSVERDKRVPIRTVHLGTAGEPPGEGVYVECNRILVTREAKADFARSLVATIKQDRDWDQLMLDGFVAEDAELVLAAEPGLHARHESCPVIDLRPALEQGGQAVDLLSSSSRYKVRRSIRGFGDIETDWAETPDQALAILDELIPLHQERWQAAGQPGVFSSDRFTGFHRDLIERLAGSGVVLFRVRGDQGTIGCLYNLIDNKSVLSYQSGFAAFADNKLRPGFVCHTLCMQASVERGYEEYNFLEGGSSFKTELSTDERALIWATGRRRRARWLVAEGLRTRLERRQRVKG
jgi:CelD/BcsL family acetyltransferase involved in cellulose biosynthesis